MVRLNAAAFDDPDSLLVYLKLPTISDSVSAPALIDSGSSHCFIDSSFVSHYSVPTQNISPVQLRLLDGSDNTFITQKMEMPIVFPTGETFFVEFLVTPLDPNCPLVIGHRWLRQHNPLIDWSRSIITFRTSEPTTVPTPPGSPCVKVNAKAATPLIAPLTSVPPEPSAPPSISLINAVAFARACKLPGSRSFTLSLNAIFGRASDPVETPDLSAIPEEYRDFSDVFSKAKADTLAQHRPYDLKIELEDGGRPPPGRVYSLSPSELKSLREFLDEHLSLGFIRPSSSPHGAPVLFVKKKDGSLRLCVDFRGLNRITKKDRYPLPLISDLLDSPGNARVYTKIDLRHAYHLVRITDGDEWKTTFRTRYGSFEWMVMPFGLTNAPAAFQRFVNDVFADMLDVSVVVYLDDILIYSENPEEHRRHVREVLKRLRQNGLYAKAEKCEFSKDTVEYLGYILSPDGLSMDPAKIKTILEWPEPRKIKEVQSFLGFANFYRRFIENYSDITIPLTRLTRKDTPWNFDGKCRAAFERLKKAFTSAPILVHWTPDAKLIVETDASDYALGAILSLISDDGEIHPVAFYSRSFSPAELNYDTHDKELLAIFCAFQQWRQYLEGSGDPVEVFTDHKNLEYFSTTKLLTRRQVRWSEYLNQFNLVIRFRPGRLGEKPDSLTRRWDVYPKGGNSDYAVVNPQNYRPVFTQDQLRASLRASALAGPVIQNAVILDLDQLHSDIRDALATDSVSAAHLPTPSDPKWTLAPDGLLRRYDRIYVPDSNNLRLRILQYSHDHILAGHFGQNKTLQLVRQQYFWPNLRTFVQNYCKSCTTCMRSKSQRHKPYGTLQQLPIPEKPWNSISMDFIEQLPVSSGFTSILVVVDRLSKQSIFIPTTDTINSAELARLFVIHVFSKHGVPEHVTSDRGSEFVSRFFRSLGTALDMRLHFTSGYHPEGDGQTERVNQTLEQYLRIFTNYQQDNWSDLLPLAEFAYNNSPNASTGVSPFFANKGYHPNISVHPERDLASQRARDFVVDLDELHRTLREQIALAQRRYQGPADARRTPPPNLQVGDHVFVRSDHIRTTRPSKKLAEKFLGPFEVIAKPSRQSYTLRLPQHLRSIHPVFHVSQLEPQKPDVIPNRTQPPPPPIAVDGELEYEIAEVLDSKIDNRRRTCKLLYLVRWSGYENTDEETSWVLATELEHAQEVVTDFHARYPSKPGPL